MKKKKLFSYALIAAMVFSGIGTFGTNALVVSANSDVSVEEATDTPTILEGQTSNEGDESDSTSIANELFSNFQKSYEYTEDEIDQLHIPVKNLDIYIKFISYATYLDETLTEDDYIIGTDEIILTNTFLNKLSYGENKIVVHPVSLIEGLIGNLEITITKNPNPAKINIIKLISNIRNSGSTIIQQFYISPIKGEKIDIKDVTIRFYFDDKSSAKKIFECMEGCLLLDKSPYYVKIEDSVAGEFHEGYIEYSFNQSYVINADDTLNINTRIFHEDWSPFNSDKTKDKIEVYYKGFLTDQNWEKKGLSH